MACQDRLTALGDLCMLKSMPKDLSQQACLRLEQILKLAPNLVGEPNPVNLLPRTMRNELLLYQSLEALGRLRLLDKLDKDTLGRLAEVLRPCSFVAGQAVYGVHEAATEMYFVVRGTLELRDHTGTRGDLVRQSEPLGMLEMWPENLPMMIPMRAHTATVVHGPCTLLELRKEDLNGLVRSLMPDVYAAIKALAQESARMVDADSLRRAIRAHTHHRCVPLNRLLSSRSIQHLALLKSVKTPFQSTAGPVSNRSRALGDAQTVVRSPDRSSIHKISYAPPSIRVHPDPVAASGPSPVSDDHLTAPPAQPTDAGITRPAGQAPNGKPMARDDSFLSAPRTAALLAVRPISADASPPRGTPADPLLAGRSTSRDASPLRGLGDRDSALGSALACALRSASSPVSSASNAGPQHDEFDPDRPMPWELEMGLAREGQCGGAGAGAEEAGRRLEKVERRLECVDGKMDSLAAEVALLREQMSRLTELLTMSRMEQENLVSMRRPS